jgi:putative membrane protein
MTPSTSSSSSPPPSLSPRWFAVANALVTTFALGFLVWLVYFHDEPRDGSVSTQLPALNACFNALAASLLVLGRRAIRRGQRRLHQQLMLSALAASALFLVTYIYYHYGYGDTKFPGQGAVRGAYFAILISHIGLSAIVFPAILTSVYLGLADRIATHKRVARWTWAGWMYVSITGIVIWLMLHVIDWS